MFAVHQNIRESEFHQKSRIDEKYTYLQLQRRFFQLDSYIRPWDVLLLLFVVLIPEVLESVDVAFPLGYWGVQGVFHALLLLLERPFEEQVVEGHGDQRVVRHHLKRRSY